MMKMTAFLGIALALGGCVKIGGGKPPASLLNLTSAVRVAADDARMAGVGETMTVGVPGVPQAIATNRVAVNDGDTSIAYVKDAQWVEPPARLFQRLLSETVAAKTGKILLDPRQFEVEPGTQLAGQLRQFGIDAPRSEAVVVYDAALSRDHGKQISTRRFEARVGVGVIAAGPAGAALNRAANKVAADVSDWIIAQK